MIFKFLLEALKVHSDSPTLQKSDAIYGTESKIKTYVIVLPWTINIPA